MENLSNPAKNAFSYMFEKITTKIERNPIWPRRNPILGAALAILVRTPTSRQISPDLARSRQISPDFPRSHQYLRPNQKILNFDADYLIRCSMI